MFDTYRILCFHMPPLLFPKKPTLSLSTVSPSNISLFIFGKPTHSLIKPTQISPKKMSSSTTASALILLLCTFWAVAVNGAGHQHASAPAPTAVDCSTLVLSMADCLSFVSNDSTTTQPEKSCCTGLKTVLKTDAQCLCEAFKSSAQLGIVLNVTKAVTLPAACKLHAPSVSNCGLALTPAGAPGVSPSTAAAPGVFPGANQQAPSPSPGEGGAHGLTISVGSLVIGLIIASFSTN